MCEDSVGKRGVFASATDTRAVSPVLGVLLMLAVTIVLAALVGGSALGLTNQSAEVAPQVSFHTGWEGFGDGDTENDALVLEHQSGVAMDAEAVTVVVDGVTVYERGVANPDGLALTVEGWDGETVRAGETLVVREDGGNVFDASRVTVYYESDGKSFVLAEN